MLVHKSAFGFCVSTEYSSSSSLSRKLIKKPIFQTTPPDRITICQGSQSASCRLYACKEHPWKKWTLSYVSSALEAQGYVVLSTNNQLCSWSTAGFLDKRCLGPEGFARFDGVLDRGFGRSRWVSYDFTTHGLKEGE